uniref:proline and serine-rich protein 3 isoform X1 n=1 Tax=Centroberyx gerrardi TaxID=166262 RepID=UPI003AAD0C3C
MKSSGAVFTKQNPFPPASAVGKTYYHPSRIQCLSKKKKKTTLSPVRSSQRVSPPLHSLSQDDQRLLGKPNHLHPTTDGQPSFSESWPSTDLETSPANTTASSSMETPKQSAPAVSFDQAQQDSVLAKYIERFRHGRPQSREERQQRASAIGEEQLPFWWMSPSSLPPCSTPTQTTDKDVILPLKDDHAPAILSPVGQCRRGSTPSPHRGSPSVSAFVLSDTSHGDLDDTEILQLQERASRLLQKSDGSIPISSEGLGCSDFSSPISVDEPVRRPLIPSLMESATVQAGPSQKSSVTPSLVHHTRPEEDILFQWRLRRKMEQAREGPQSQQYSSLHRSTFSWQSPGLHQPSVSGQTHKQQQSIHPPEPSCRVTPSFIIAPQPETKEAHGPCPSATGPSPSPPFLVSDSSVPKLQTDAHVPAHMHLLCDVLPCPARSSHRSTQQRSSQREGSRTKVAPKKTQQVPGNSTDTSTEEPISKHMSSPPPASSGSTEEEWPFHHRRAERRNKKAQTKESEKNEKRTAMSIRKQKKSMRHHIRGDDHADGPCNTNRSSSRHSRSPKKVTPWTEQPSSRNGGQKERCQGFSSESCTGDRAPPPSPIHSALGQVVSEVLFPTLDSSPAQRTPVSSDSPPYTPYAPPQSPVPPGNAQNPMEVISQLLREAEDSDETDFEDDPLLQVLRKQRKWVKEQISEVDSMLDEFQDG